MRRVDVGSKKTRVIWKRIGRAGAVAKRARLDYGTVGAHGVMKNAYPSNRQAAIVPTAQENGKEGLGTSKPRNLIFLTKCARVYSK